MTNAWIGSSLWTGTSWLTAFDLEAHRVRLVENPLTISLRQLLYDYDNFTYPITLVCAGNRRKEQNVVRKSKGFSWGPAGVSTALFTGVVMSDVIRRAKPKRGARYVCMEGADRLPNGYYGTSVKLNWVMDPNRGIMLAHGMNGEPLRPDHGKPLRAVIPGQIGGRSVKWLKKLTITDKPSDNWYHIYDNRVLPTMVSPETAANDQNWWMDERYAIYDLSTNSAIAYPAHEEQLGLVGAAETYKCKGYAYGGGGRRVTRVEVSTDQGKNWSLANIDYAEDRYRESEKDSFGGRLDMAWRETCFCWCFWTLDVPLQELEKAKDLVVRAMDEGMCVQPRDLYWNVLGMMNNPWYRIAINRERDYLRFEHPTQPALMPGGWMERVKKAGGNLTNGYWGEKVAGDEANEQAEETPEEIPMTKDGPNKEITIDELRKHETSDRPWFVLNGEVYDGTTFLEEHPGGATSIINAAATDATEEFMAIHSETAKAMMSAYHIGTLDSTSRAALSQGGVASDSAKPRPVFLQQRAWSTATLCSKKEVSWDTRIFTYKLDHDEQTLGLPTGQHLQIRLRDPVTREAIIRAYTPISETSRKGYMDVLVKVYFAKDGTAGGKMSMAMESLPIGHGVDFKGPVGKFEYCGRGQYTINSKSRSVNRFVMICGGSGVTPIYQVFRAVMRDTEDKTSCIVLNGNRSQEDILCKDELDMLVINGKGRGQIHYTLTKPNDDWKGGRGRIDPTLVARKCPRKEGVVALICGPEAMEKSMRCCLKEQGWPDEDVVFF